MNRNVLGRLMRDAEAIVALYREGVSLADLGIRWNCHSNTMKRFLTSQDVVLRGSRPRRELNQAEIARLLDEGWDAQEVARMFNVRTEALAEYLVEKCGVITSKHDRHRRSFAAIAEATCVHRVREKSIIQMMLTGVNF